MTDTNARYQMLKINRKTDKVTWISDTHTYDECHNLKSAHERGIGSKWTWYSVQEAGAYPLGSSLPKES